MEKKLSTIYYDPKNLWKGYVAIKKLSVEADVSENIAKMFLKKQALWQIYKPKPKYIPFFHWTISEPNKIHQADLLFLPYDTYKRKTYKYALTIICVASRYKESEPLTSKNSNEVAKAFEKIYKRSLLVWPEILMVDPGKEFFGSVTILMKKHNVKIQRSEAGNHRAQAFVEKLNKEIGQKIFSRQYAQEMIMEKGRSREWVKYFHLIIRKMNNEKIQIIGNEPDDAIKLENVEIEEKKFKSVVGLDEEKLDGFSQVRYLYRDGKLEGGENHRGTGPIWSLRIFYLDRIVVYKNQPVLYYLQ